MIYTYIVYSENMDVNLEVLQSKSMFLGHFTRKMIEK